MKLPSLLDRLHRSQGARPIAPRADPFAAILHENVAYLVDDARRDAAFAALRDRVGISAAAILEAPEPILSAIAQLGGMLPAQRVAKLRKIATLVEALGADDLDATLAMPPKEARKTFARFPGIGKPGADKLLLFCGIEPVLALESNGLRTLCRLGFGTEHANYAATYRSVCAALEELIPRRRATRVRAYEVLRRHGREVCRNTRPACATCVLRADCPYAKSAGRG